MQEHKLFYRKHLPHIQPQRDYFFITYRLLDSLPIGKIRELENQAAIRQRNAKTKQEKYDEQKRSFAVFDEELDKSLNEPHWLKDDAIASIIAGSLQYGNDKLYKLWCYCIMPNHVHIVITTLPGAPPLYAILQNHKKFTARASNKILKRTGQFWTHESYDHLIRNNEEFNKIVFYTINNPVKARLVKHWKDWKWTCIDSELKDMFL